jgi:hypothetical protein
MKKIIIIQTIYDEAYPLKKGYARITLNEKYGFADSKGNILIQPKYDWASDFSEGLPIVHINGKYGFIDKKETLLSNQSVIR